jgi:hypothetical protein
VSSERRDHDAARESLEQKDYTAIDLLMRSKILPISLVPETFDQPFQLVELAAVSES